MFLYFILIAFCAGIVLAIQAAINTQLALSLGGESIISAFISFFIGAIVLFFICLWKTDLFNSLSTIYKLESWKLLGGTLGAFVVFTTIFLSPKLGITNMLFFIIIGQLISAAIIDHYGLIGMSIKSFDLWKFIGFIIIGIGLFIYFFGKRILG
ncbi:DMT family transporter [Pasteurella skyensis]|uniref:DMT family transporter n=1 Tax=Phocoenobacter skyensis TaxID=97481 RepID=A0AAJ6NBI0_9PAST|nr:DMT family transporter [Pasteurella skyensis]MDP8162548.1 DMT family transporter [Pasteurella skyensis]MDP8171204.1 DMT family transporter [Pasteurella skyensis]MDP8173746.1 DMT family transporter [Pasteurella skyensis]MDP8175477.1 DMT family transporter [Pasteurella skyensis]MDP8177302.1 DMT family transporter [Pasteurella skyensis]